MCVWVVVVAGSFVYECRRLRKPEEGVKSHGAEVAGSYEPPHVSAGNGTQLPFRHTHILL